MRGRCASAVILTAFIDCALVCLVFTPWTVAATADVVSDPSLFSEQGYRIARYRRALPEQPPVGVRVSTTELVALIEQEQPLLIDVQAITLRPETAEFGLSWLPSSKRLHLPDSIWLPNVGYGRLSPQMLDYLTGNLQRLSQGAKDRALVFYCVVDCWMSWNAIKRASELGYSRLYWYPEGSDGWSDAGLPLVEGHPVPLATESAGEDGAKVSNACQAEEDASFFQCRQADLHALLSGLDKAEGPSGALLFFEAEHCPFCKRMRRTVLRDPEVIDFVHARFAVAALDIESNAGMLDPSGAKTTQQAYATRVQRVVRTPTMVFVDRQGEELYRHSGVIIDKRVLMALAEYVSGGHFDNMGFREYVKR